MSEKEKIQAGFNKGYLIAKYKPSLAQLLAKGILNTEAPYSIGLSAGIKEANDELSKLKHKNFDFSKSYKKRKRNKKDINKEFN